MPQRQLSFATEGAGRSGDHALDRFVAFAFAAADLLVETTADHVIGFAAGAFLTRFGCDPSAFLGRHLRCLIDPLDQPRLNLALAAAWARGRLPPLLLRLSDAHRTEASLAALAMPGPPPRLCVTLSPAPAPVASPSPGAAVGPGPASLLQAAAQRLQNGGAGGHLQLLELRLPPGSIGPADLRASIAAAVAADGGSAMTSEIAEGRFGVLSPDASDLTALVSRLEQSLRATPSARGASVRGSSMSLATDGLEPAQAVRALRFALACFAERGADGVQDATQGEGLAGLVARAGSRARAMRQSIADRRYRILFQPIVRLSDREVHHFEALLRPIPTRGNPLQSTQEFVTFAETVGLAEELDEAVLQDVLTRLRERRCPAIAVNLSGLSMQSTAFHERAERMIAASGCASRLLVEVTETADVTDVASAARLVRQLRDAGARVCIDDFGAGAAGFGYLRAFAVDFIKLDGSYTGLAASSERDRGLVSAMVDLAASVAAPVIAEAIETDAQSALLSGIGIGFGQGWLFGRPGHLPGDNTATA